MDGSGLQVVKEFHYVIFVATELAVEIIGSTDDYDLDYDCRAVLRVNFYQGIAICF